MKIKIETFSFPLHTPFAITGHIFKASNTVRVTLMDGVYSGCGEGVGVYYCQETAQSMMTQLLEIADQIESGVTRTMLKDLLPTGGARNALDCALWDLEAKRVGKSIWGVLNIKPHVLSSVATLGIDSPEQMAIAARNFTKYPSLKIKLSSDEPIARLEAVRAARPDAKLIVDVNQGWTFDELQEYTPIAQRLGVAMIEQPLMRGADAELEDFTSVVPLGADESCLNVAEYEVAAKRYDVINIKLDKCGGLTEGLELVKLAQRDGKGLMIGNMTGSSLSMAPAYVIGQYCQFIDIDGPLFLEQDIENGLTYGDGGSVSIPAPELWG